MSKAFINRLTLKSNITLRAMTTPALMTFKHELLTFKHALMTFSRMLAIYFYCSAKFAFVSMYSYLLNIWLAYFPMHRGFETHSWLLLRLLNVQNQVFLCKILGF